VSPAELGPSVMSPMLAPLNCASMPARALFEFKNSGVALARVPE